MVQSACAALRFSVAADGTVQDLVILAENPPGIGFGQTALALQARYVYPAADAGGPYATLISVGTTTALAVPH
jgi:hypothetical protein